MSGYLGTKSRRKPLIIFINTPHYRKLLPFYETAHHVYPANTSNYYSTKAARRAYPVAILEECVMRTIWLWLTEVFPGWRIVPVIAIAIAIIVILVLAWHSIRTQ